MSLPEQKTLKFVRDATGTNLFVNLFKVFFFNIFKLVFGFFIFYFFKCPCV